MIHRRAFVVAAAATLGAPGAFAQGAPRRIGYLATGSSPGLNLRNALVDELRKLGWVEGRTLAIESRFAEGRFDRLPALAAELVRANVELIAAGPSPAAVAARQATSTIPIVMLVVGDPVGLGLVASLARPGGNVTGTAFDVAFDVFRKQLELLREAVPRVQRVGLLSNPANPGTPLAMGAIRSAASSMGLALVSGDARDPAEFEAAFARIASERAGAVLVISDTVFNPHAAQLVALSDRHRLPMVTTVRAYPEAGALMAYGPSFEHLYRRSALYVDRILKGAKPAELPVEQPTQFELVVNVAAARRFGLTLPAPLLSRADVVIR